MWKQLSLHQVILPCLAPSHHEAGCWNCCWASPCVDSCLLCLPVRDPPLCALSDLCRAGAGLQGPPGPEGETAETPGTGSGREGLLPLTEQGCGESCLCPGPCLTTVSPGRLGRSDSPFPYLPSLQKPLSMQPTGSGGG